MKSIRLALTLYFLLLVGAALGAVYWFAYQTSSATLNARRERTEKLLEGQYHSDCEDARAALDQRLFRNAQTLANMARATYTHLESLYPLGAMGTPAPPFGSLAAPLWLAEGFQYPLAFDLHLIYPRIINIESGEDVLAEGDYFQAYSSRGQPLEKSASLGDAALTLDPEWRKSAELLRPNFDTVEVRPGHSVRRVTLKTAVSRFGRYGSFLPPLWRFPAGKMKLPEGPKIAGSGKRPNFGNRGGQSPTIFIQYASDTTGLKATLRELKSRLDADLAQQEQDTAEALGNLRSRLLAICSLAFGALLAGVYGLVRFGLSPLRKLSEAVSRVSEKNFKLQIETRKLPGELQPIAACLTQTLEQLRRAFAREKQAAADISHELRTPLAALLANLDVALRKPRTPQEYQEILQDCRSSGQQMTQLVERLLALARLDAGADTLRAREVDVVNLATQCAEMVRPLADARGLTLRLHTNGSATLQADPDKLREVLNNLLYNAIEYNRPNGAIDLAVERINGLLAVEVRDTGIGIPPEAREHIFERFFRADPSRHADGMHAGIGLAIVKGYVDLMGGTIGVDSSDAGSTFRVKFPVR